MNTFEWKVSVSEPLFAVGGQGTEAVSNLWLPCGGTVRRIILSYREMLPVLQFIYSLDRFLGCDSTNAVAEVLFSAIVFNEVGMGVADSDMGVVSPVRIAVHRKSQTLCMIAVSVVGDTDIFVVGEGSLDVFRGGLKKVAKYLYGEGVFSRYLDVVTSNPFWESTVKSDGLMGMLEGFLSWETANGRPMSLIANESSASMMKDEHAAISLDKASGATEGTHRFSLVFDATGEKGGVWYIDNPYTLVRLLCLMEAAFCQEGHKAATAISAASDTVNKDGGTEWIWVSEGAPKQHNLTTYHFKWRVFMAFDHKAGDVCSVVFDLNGKAQVCTPVHLPMLAQLVGASPSPVPDVSVGHALLPSWVRDVWAGVMEGFVLVRGYS